MLKTAEAVSLGHPDKTADYIASYILDRMLEQDPAVRFAVEVMIKANTVVLGGEISGKVKTAGLKDYVRQALDEVGYSAEYAKRWGSYAIEPDKLKVIELISAQSDEISNGVSVGGWGDQGVFVGYACKGEGNISREQYQAQKLCRELYRKALKSKLLGIDIKTQVTLDEKGDFDTVIVAIPMLRKVDLRDAVVKILGQEPRRLIVNGAGEYKCHSAVADCGMTGRKLACDFYGTACSIGGGSPWTKDASKADVTLNLYARYLAKEFLADNDEAVVLLSSCIGKADLPSAEIKLVKGGKSKVQQLHITQKPAEIIELLGLNRPVFAAMCREGLIK